MENTDLAAECENLARDFGRLFLADASGVLRIYRTEFPTPQVSLKQNGTACPTLTNQSSTFLGYINFSGNPSELMTQAEGLFMYPQVSLSPNQPAKVIKNGWSSNHSIHFLGGHSKKQFFDTLKRANDFVVGHQQLLGSILYPGRKLYFYNCCWPDIMIRIAELSNSKLYQPQWMIPRPNTSIENWKRRHVIGIGYFLDDPTERPKFGFQFSSEDEKRIGDEPTAYFCLRNTFIKDSETAFEWLAKELRNKQPVAPVVVPSDPQKEIRAEALAVVVAGGLAGTVQAAVSLPAGDRISEVMRSMLASDERYYAWTAEKWVKELTASKPTITGCVAWKEIMRWREAKKQSAMPVKTAMHKAELSRRKQHKKLAD